MKTAISIIGITLVLISTLGALNTGYDMSSFRPADLLEYSLAPMLSSKTVNSYQNEENKQSRLSNEISVTGSVTKEKPGYYLYLKATNSYSYGSGRRYVSDSYYADKTLSWASEFMTSYQGEYRRYINSFCLGAEYTGSVSKEWDNANEYDPDQTTIRRYKNLHLYNQFTGILGVGRLYQSQEAYIAWYLYKELDKNGCLNRQVSASEIDETATLLYQLRSMHELDSRILFRKQVVKLLDHLKTQEYLNANSESKAQAILLDLVTGSTPNAKPILFEKNDTEDSSWRLTGTRFEARPFASVKSDKNTQRVKYEPENILNYTDRFYFAESGLELAFRYERPWLNVFQLSSGVSAIHGWYDAFYEETTNDTLNVNWRPYTHLKAVSVVSYFPDCRSNISLGVGGTLMQNNTGELTSYDFLKPLKPIVFDKGLDYSELNQLVTDNQRLDLDLSLNAFYQLTPAITISGQLIGYYIRDLHEGKVTSQSKNLQSDFRISYRLY